MPKFRIQGRIYDVPTVEAAKTLHRNYLAGGEVNAAEDMGLGEQILAGTGSGLINIGRQTANMVLPESMQPDWATDEAIAEQARIDAPLLKTGGGMTGRVGGEIAGSMLPGGLAMKGARALGATGRMLPLAVGGATEGAILAGPGQRGSGAATGAALAGTLGLLGKAGRGATGRTGLTPGAQVLAREGIDVMPGYARKSGVLKAMEESAGGRLMPGVKEARQLNIDDTVRAMMRRAAPGKEVRERIQLNKGARTLDQDLQDLYESFEGMYGAAKGYKIKPISPDGQDLFASVRQAIKSVSVSKEARRRAKPAVEEVLDGLSLKRGALQSDDLIKARSKIRAEMRRYEKMVDPDYDRLKVLDAAEDAITDALEAQLPVAARGVLRRADKQFSKYKAIEDIMYSRADGDMTTNAMVQGIKRAEARAGGRSSAARGANLTGLRDLSKAAGDTLVQTTTPTGMSAVMPWAAGLAGTAAGGPAGGLIGAGMTGLVPGLTAASNLARRAAVGNTAPQRAFARTLDAIGRPLEHIGQGTRIGAMSYMNQE